MDGGKSDSTTENNVTTTNTTITFLDGTQTTEHVVQRRRHKNDYYH